MAYYSTIEDDCSIRGFDCIILPILYIAFVIQFIFSSHVHNIGVCILMKTHPLTKVVIFKPCIQQQFPHLHQLATSKVTHPTFGMTIIYMLHYLYIQYIIYPKTLTCFSIHHQLLSTIEFNTI